MMKTVHKLFWVWEFDKEERWLNEMAAQGWVLEKIGYCTYTFVQCEPGEYMIRLELLENRPSHKSSLEYIEFLEETKAQYLGSMMRWVYFRKKTTDGEFNLFSDNQSRIQHLNRMLQLMLVLMFLEFSVGLFNIGISFSVGMGVNLVAGVLCLLLSILFAYGSWRLKQKKNRLKKEQQLYEG